MHNYMGTFTSIAIPFLFLKSRTYVPLGTLRQRNFGLKCGFENPEGMRFCGQCTAPLALVCPKCHFQNPPGFKFCGQCTAALGPAPIKLEPARVSLTIRES